MDVMSAAEVDRRLVEALRECDNAGLEQMARHQGAQRSRHIAAVYQLLLALRGQIEAMEATFTERLVAYEWQRDQLIKEYYQRRQQRRVSVESSLSESKRTTVDDGVGGENIGRSPTLRDGDTSADAAAAAATRGPGGLVSPSSMSSAGTGQWFPHQPTSAAAAVSTQVIRPPLLFHSAVDPLLHAMGHQLALDAPSVVTAPPPQLDTAVHDVEPGSPELSDQLQVAQNSGSAPGDDLFRCLQARVYFLERQVKERDSAIAELHSRMARRQRQLDHIRSTLQVEVNSLRLALASSSSTVSGSRQPPQTVLRSTSVSAASSPQPNRLGGDISSSQMSSATAALHSANAVTFSVFDVVDLVESAEDTTALIQQLRDEADRNARLQDAQRERELKQQAERFSGELGLLREAKQQAEQRVRAEFNDRVAALQDRNMELLDMNRQLQERAVHAEENERSSAAKVYLLQTELNRVQESVAALKASATMPSTAANSNLGHSADESNPNSPRRSSVLVKPGAKGVAAAGGSRRKSVVLLGDPSPQGPRPKPDEEAAVPSAITRGSSVVSAATQTTGEGDEGDDEVDHPASSLGHSSSGTKRKKAVFHSLASTQTDDGTLGDTYRGIDAQVEAQLDCPRCAEAWRKVATGFVNRLRPPKGESGARNPTRAAETEPLAEAAEQSATAVVPPVDYSAAVNADEAVATLVIVAEDNESAEGVAMSYASTHRGEVLHSSPLLLPPSSHGAAEATRRGNGDAPDGGKDDPASPAVAALSMRFASTSDAVRCARDMVVDGVAAWGAVVPAASVAAMTTPKDKNGLDRQDGSRTLDLQQLVTAAASVADEAQYFATCVAQKPCIIIGESGDASRMQTESAIRANAGVARRVEQLRVDNINVPLLFSAASSSPGETAVQASLIVHEQSDFETLSRDAGLNLLPPSVLLRQGVGSFASAASPTTLSESLASPLTAPKPLSSHGRSDPLLSLAVAPHDRVMPALIESNIERGAFYFVFDPQVDGGNAFDGPLANALENIELVFSTGSARRAVAVPTHLLIPFVVSLTSREAELEWKRSPLIAVPAAVDLNPAWFPASRQLILSGLDDAQCKLAVETVSAVGDSARGVSCLVAIPPRVDLTRFFPPARAQGTLASSSGDGGDDGAWYWAFIPSQGEIMELVPDKTLPPLSVATCLQRPAELVQLLLCSIRHREAGSPPSVTAPGLVIPDPPELWSAITRKRLVTIRSPSEESGSRHRLIAAVMVLVRTLLQRPFLIASTGGRRDVFSIYLDEDEAPGFALCCAMRLERLVAVGRCGIFISRTTCSDLDDWWNTGWEASMSPVALFSPKAQVSNVLDAHATGIRVTSDFWSRPPRSGWCNSVEQGSRLRVMVSTMALRGLSVATGSSNAATPLRTRMDETASVDALAMGGFRTLKLTPDHLVLCLALPQGEAAPKQRWRAIWNALSSSLCSGGSYVVSHIEILGLCHEARLPGPYHDSLNSVCGSDGGVEQQAPVAEEGSHEKTENAAASHLLCWVSVELRDTSDDSLYVTWLDALRRVLCRGMRAAVARVTEPRIGFFFSDPEAKSPRYPRVGSMFSCEEVCLTGAMLCAVPPDNLIASWRQGMSLPSQWTLVEAPFLAGPAGVVGPWGCLRVITSSAASAMHTDASIGGCLGSGYGAWWRKEAPPDSGLFDPTSSRIVSIRLPLRQDCDAYLLSAAGHASMASISIDCDLGLVERTPDYAIFAGVTWSDRDGLVPPAALSADEVMLTSSPLTIGDHAAFMGHRDWLWRVRPGSRVHWTLTTPPALPVLCEPVQKALWPVISYVGYVVLGESIDRLGGDDGAKIETAARGLVNAYRGIYLTSPRAAAADAGDADPTVLTMGFVAAADAVSCCLDIVADLTHVDYTNETLSRPSCTQVLASQSLFGPRGKIQGFMDKDHVLLRGPRCVAFVHALHEQPPHHTAKGWVGSAPSSSWVSSFAAAALQAQVGRVVVTDAVSAALGNLHGRAFVCRTLGCFKVDLSDAASSVASIKSVQPPWISGHRLPALATIIDQSPNAAPSVTASRTAASGSAALCERIGSLFAHQRFHAGTTHPTTACDDRLTQSEHDISCWSVTASAERPAERWAVLDAFAITAMRKQSSSHATCVLSGGCVNLPGTNGEAPQSIAWLAIAEPCLDVERQPAEHRLSAGSVRGRVILSRPVGAGHPKANMTQQLLLGVSVLRAILNDDQNNHDHVWLSALHFAGHYCSSWPAPQTREIVDTVDAAGLDDGSGHLFTSQVENGDWDPRFARLYSTSEMGTVTRGGLLPAAGFVSPRQHHAGSDRSQGIHVTVVSLVTGVSRMADGILAMAAVRGGEHSSDHQNTDSGSIAWWSEAGVMEAPSSTRNAVGKDPNVAEPRVYFIKLVVTHHGSRLPRGIGQLLRYVAKFSEEGGAHTATVVTVFRRALTQRDAMWLDLLSGLPTAAVEALAWSRDAARHIYMAERGIDVPQRHAVFAITLDEQRGMWPVPHGWTFAATDHNAASPLTTHKAEAPKWKAYRMLVIAPPRHDRSVVPVVRGSEEPSTPTMVPDDGVGTLPFAMLVSESGLGAAYGVERLLNRILRLASIAKDGVSFLSVSSDICLMAIAADGLPDQDIKAAALADSIRASLLPGEQLLFLPRSVVKRRGPFAGIPSRPASSPSRMARNVAKTTPTVNRTALAPSATYDVGIQVDNHALTRESELLVTTTAAAAAADGRSLVTRETAAAAAAADRVAHGSGPVPRTEQPSIVKGGDAERQEEGTIRQGKEHLAAATPLVTPLKPPMPPTTPRSEATTALSFAATDPRRATASDSARRERAARIVSSVESGGGGDVFFLLGEASPTTPLRPQSGRPMSSRISGPRIGTFPGH